MKISIFAAMLACTLAAPCLAGETSRDLCIKDFLNPRDSTSFIMLKDKAVGILPPETIAGSYVLQARWSPSGEYIAVLAKSNLISQTGKAFDPERTPESSVANLGIWSSKTRTLTWVWSCQEEKLQVLEWLPGSDTMIAQVLKDVEREVWEGEKEETVSVEVSVFTHIDAKRKKATTVFECDGAKFELQLHVAPKAALAILESYTRPSYLWLITSDAKAETISLPEGSGSYSLAWLEDGATPLFIVFTGNDGEKFPDGRKLYSFDTASKTFTELPSKPNPKGYEHPAPLPSPLVSVPVDMPKGYDGPKINTLWLEQADTDGKKSRALVAADSDLYALSPSKNEILYRAEGALFVRKLCSYPRSSVDLAFDTLKRAKLTTQAHQIGVVFKVYALDNDQMLPDAEGFIEKLLPYCQAAMLDNFVYCLNGDKLIEIDYPSDTVLGYITGDGGYAVVYADGLARWRKELPKQ